MADKRRRTGRTQRRQDVRTESYNIKTLHEDREYGLYWYSWLWKILRPVMIFLCSALIVTGIVSYGYGKVYDGLLGPVDANSSAVVSFEIKSGASIAEIGREDRRGNLGHLGHRKPPVRKM